MTRPVLGFDGTDNRWLLSVDGERGLLTEIVCSQGSGFSNGSGVLGGETPSGVCY